MRKGRYAAMSTHDSTPSHQTANTSDESNLGFAMLRGPTTVLFGRGSSRMAGEVAVTLGKRTLLVTDAGVRRTGLVEPIVAALDAAGIEAIVWDRVNTDFGVGDVAEATDATRDVNPDFFTAIGGGSCIDMAKLTSLIFTHGGNVSDYFGEGRVPGPTMPLLALPTTAGTGSEVSPVAVVTNEMGSQKVGVSSMHIAPNTAVVDPALTDGCPPPVSASSGMDAIAHAVEAYTAARRESPSVVPAGFIGKNALSDGLAVDAMRHLGPAIVEAVATGASAARDAMAYGSLVAGMSFAQAGTGLAHALQYPIGHLTGTAHGVGVGMLLPYAMAFNRPVRQLELRDAGVALGLVNPELTVREAAFEAVLAVDRLRKEVGLPDALSELGLSRTSLLDVADRALTTRRLIDNNGRIPELEDLRRVLDAAFDGDLLSLLEVDDRSDA
jgi:alcohol dehydrogenase